MTPDMNVTQCAEVIKVGLDYCSEIMDPNPLSDKTVYEVLTKAGIKVMEPPVDNSPLE
jgi:hypothetical protein